MMKPLISATGCSIRMRPEWSARDPGPVDRLEVYPATFAARDKRRGAPAMDGAAGAAVGLSGVGPFRHARRVVTGATRLRRPRLDSPRCPWRGGAPFGPSPAPAGAPACQPAPDVVVGDALDPASVTRQRAPGDALRPSRRTPRASPAKAAEPRRVDLPVRRRVGAQSRTRPGSRALRLRERRAAGARGEGVPRCARGRRSHDSRGGPDRARFVRPWSVLGPGRRWPLLLVPFLRAGARRAVDARGPPSAWASVTIDQIDRRPGPRDRGCLRRPAARASLNVPADSRASRLLEA